jgi:hypothetical protein
MKVIKMVLILGTKHSKTPFAAGVPKRSPIQVLTKENVA